MAFQSSIGGEKQPSFWFGNSLDHNKLFSPRAPKTRFPCVSTAQVKDSMKIYLLLIRVHTDLKAEPPSACVVSREAREDA